MSLLAACAEQEFTLPGDREDVRAILPGGGEEITTAENAGPAVLPAVTANRDWTHTASGPDHNAPHASFGVAPTLIWTAPIGEGDGRRARITASPVSDGARIYVMDSASNVSAVSPSGAVQWSSSLVPAGDRADSAVGGGLAVAGGRLFVTTGFGTLAALDAATGERIWTHNFRSVASGAPTVAGGQVFALTRNGIAWALNANTGRINWSVAGLASDVGITGGPSIAVTADGVAILPFPGGDLAAVDAATGAPRWRAVIAGRRLEPVAARISDITGDPVVAGDIVVAASHSGRTLAVNRTTGADVWRSDEGAMAAPIVAGNSIFQVTDRNTLVRLERATGLVVWSQPLPLFRSNRPRRFDAVFAHFGPLLAGGRLIVASDDGALRFFDPSTGVLTGQVDLPSGAASDPIIVDGTLYVVSENGRLHAFR